MKKIRNAQRYTNFPIPSTRTSKVTIPEVESSALDDYKSYPMPELLWKNLLVFFRNQGKARTLGTNTCFEIKPATADELSLFPTGLSNDDLREYFFKKLSSQRKMTGGWDYRERSIQSLPTSGASMYKPSLCFDPKDMAKLSVRTLFTKDTIQALNQVSHDISIDVHLLQLIMKMQGERSCLLIPNPLDSNFPWCPIDKPKQ